jgi:hypothetical protein
MGKNMFKKVVIPAPFCNGVNSSRNPDFILLVLDSRFHGNDRKNGPLKSFVSKS